MVETARPVRIEARSVSRRLWDDGLVRPGTRFRVQAIFARACLLVTPGGDLLALVTAEIGDGPRNAVLDRSAPPSLFADLEPGLPAEIQGTSLQVGHLAISLVQVQSWEPRPNWSKLRASKAPILPRLPDLLSLARQQAPPESLLDLLAEPSPSDPPSAILGAARQALRLLQRGWAGDRAALEVGAAKLAGLGRGLTPAGDDFLAGLMLGAWLIHPTPDDICQRLLAAAAPRTTALSAAFLRAASQGECSASWHHLLAALADREETPLDRALPEILAHGQTSGADTLAGFLWLALSDPLVDGPLDHIPIGR
jgi:hypothetical protein